MTDTSRRVVVVMVVVVVVEQWEELSPRGDLAVRAQAGTVPGPLRRMLRREAES